jgi:hypothetical protein
VGAQHVALLALDSSFHEQRAGSFRLTWHFLVLVIHHDDAVGRQIFEEAPVWEGRKEVKDER